MVVRMKWMVKFRKLLIVAVVICLLGTIAQACHDYEENEGYEEEKEEEIVEEEPYYESASELTDSKWFQVLENLIERFPIIERIIERIFQWIFNNLLGLDY
jgi:hypothetical protein